MVLVTTPSKWDKVLKMLEDGVLGSPNDTSTIEKRLDRIERKIDVNHSKTEESIGNLSDKVDRTHPEDSTYDEKDW